MELEEAKKLKELAKGRPIPIRHNTRSMPGKSGGFGHFTPGAMIDVVGNTLVIKPRKHGGKHEFADPKHVHLWTSKAIGDGILTVEQINEVSKGSTLELDFDKVEIEKEDVADTQYVIADLGHGEGVGLQFYQGNSNKEFCNNLSEAYVYDGNTGDLNARRALAQIRRREKEWQGSFSALSNLRVIDMVEATTLYDLSRQKIKSEREAKEKERARQEASVKKPEISQQAIEAPLTMTAPLGVLGYEPSEFDLGTGQPVKEVEKPQDADALLGVLKSPAILKSLIRMQTSMQNAEAAITMLEDEKKNLLEAQKTFLTDIALEVSKMVGRIDTAIEQGRTVASGVKS